MKRSLMLVAVAAALTATAKPKAYVSHRGDYADAPEGSMAAYRNAIRFGMGAVKLDVNPSKDGVTFLSHDVSLERTMGCKGRIPDMTAEEILRHFFNYRVFGSPLWTERLVMLKQALRVLKDRIPLFWIDFKTFTPEFAEQVLREFAEAGIGRDRLMVATDPMGGALAYMRDHHPDIPCLTHIDFMEHPDGSISASFEGKRRFKDVADLERGIVAFVERMKLRGVNMLCIPEIVTKELVANLKAKGLIVSIAVLNSEREAELFVGYGNDYVVTGNVRAVRPILDR